MDNEFARGIESRLSRMEAKLEHVDKAMGTLVTRVEFRPIELVVYGLVSIILASAVGAIVTLVIGP